MYRYRNRYKDTKKVINAVNNMNIFYAVIETKKRISPK